MWICIFKCDIVGTQNLLCSASHTFKRSHFCPVSARFACRTHRTSARAQIQDANASLFRSWRHAQTRARMEALEEQMQNPGVQAQMAQMQAVMQNPQIMQRMAELRVCLPR